MTSTGRRSSSLLAVTVVVGCALSACSPARPHAARAQVEAPQGPEAFTAFRPGNGFVLPSIVLQHDPVKKTGVDWNAVKNAAWHQTSPAVRMGRAAAYLHEALQRMTGRDFPIAGQPDLSRGIVLTLLENATPDIQHDPRVIRALQPDATDLYANREAFYIRSEPERLLVVANTPDGLLDAVVELLESADYEVLGMGPNWTYVPDHHERPLQFAIERSGRPSYYLRQLSPGAGQTYGVGTVMRGLSDPQDEPVTTSWSRWIIGARLIGASMSPFPGHALQAFHRPVVERIRATGNPEGFLAEKTLVGPRAQRPEAGPENAGWLWIDNDTTGLEANQVFASDGKQWKPRPLGEIGFGLDLSVPFVREVIRDRLIAQAKAAFEKTPNDDVIFGMDAEDGAGNSHLDRYLRNKNWYPDYLAQEGLPFGRPYVLHGFKGLNQPKEIWDPTAASDVMFGTANYLLHEFDKWVDSLPEAERVTKTGTPKKGLLRCSFYSYNYHDVPPNFNLDPRIRVMIASFPKHRGLGKWANFASQEDVARAFQVMLPKEPSGDYRIISSAFLADGGPAGIPASLSASAERIVRDYGHAYTVGYRAMTHETDLNFGKNGLAYYLIAKMMWNAKLTVPELNAIRERWFRRAFGSVWQETKAYYDFMLVERYPVNGPNTWAKAIRLLDGAARKVDATKEPDVQRRLDDLKQYWYYHYLTDSRKLTKDSPELREFIWKGQMSYMVAMHAPVTQMFATNDPKIAAGPEYCTGPAHYTHAETQAWWAKVLDQWKLTPVSVFTDAKLANGLTARAVDLNDLVAVDEFQSGIADTPYVYNAGFQKVAPVFELARAKGDELGFNMTWPFKPNDTCCGARKQSYGVDVWNPKTKAWSNWIDETTAFEQSTAVTTTTGTVIQVAHVSLRAPGPATYRFRIGPGANGVSLGSLGLDPVTGKYKSHPSFAFFGGADGVTQSPVYFYIPKGTKSLDLEVEDAYAGKWIHLYKTPPAQKPGPSRKVDVSKPGTYTIALEPGEDGTIAMLQSNGFRFPYLYSVPMFWAKSPASLLVPRAIAEADHLTISKPKPN